MGKTCFVICPIGSEESSTRKRSDQVLKHIIEPVCESKGYKAVRVDKINNNDTISQTIIDYLKNSELVIADLTDCNPNAFYETGFRSALNKPLIQIIQEGQALPFDVAGIRTISYNLTDLDKAENTKQKLIETIGAVYIDKDEDNNVNNNPNSLSLENNHLNSLMLTTILDIKDNIEILRDEINKKDKENMEQLISVFANKLQENSPMTVETKIMEMFMKEFFKNPQKTINTFSSIPGFKLPG